MALFALYELPPCVRQFSLIERKGSTFYSPYGVESLLTPVTLCLQEYGAMNKLLYLEMMKLPSCIQSEEHCRVSALCTAATWSPCPECVSYLRS